MMSRAKAVDKNRLNSVTTGNVNFGTIVRKFNEMRYLQSKFFENLNQEMSSSRLQKILENSLDDWSSSLEAIRAAS